MTIKDGVSEQTLLIKLAEECSELASAAMKLATIERGDFPVRTSRQDAVNHIMEEIADTSLAILGIADCDWYDETAISTYITMKRRRTDDGSKTVVRTN